MNSPGLYDRPVLALDPGAHAAGIRHADVDAAGQVAVTGADDRTVRVWSIADGQLERTIRLPVGPGNVGKVYRVAITPDGAIIAAGGWTRGAEDCSEEQVYLFDRLTGAMTGRLGGLPSPVTGLAFAPDGARLAVAFGEGWGLRTYHRGPGGTWRDAWADTEYGDTCYGLAFGPDGQIATTCRDGRLRLYDIYGTLQAVVEASVPEPHGVAFNPLDERLAVGFRGGPEVRIYDGATLAELAAPATEGIDHDELSTIAWSADGATLYAGGRTRGDSGSPILAWGKGGAGARWVLPAGNDTLMSLKPLPDGAVFAAAGDPWLGVLSAGGTARWSVTPAQVCLNGQSSGFAVSDDGMLVEFELDLWGGDRRRFDLSALRLSSPAKDGQVHPPVQDSLDIADWFDSKTPTLDGAPLWLDPEETSFSLAIHPQGESFVLGTEWSLYALDREGAGLWHRDVLDAVWAVNITGNGRLVVAACGDGTLRWHRWEDGQELLALFPFTDGKRWVAWTPEGYYAASPGAESVLGWHVNRGWDSAGEFHPLATVEGFDQPEAIRLLLRERDIVRALGLAKLSADRLHVQEVVQSEAPPGRRLHVLAIGISDYGEAAEHLRLDFADRDAQDMAGALEKSQSSLFAQVFVSELTNEDASKEMIFEELSAMARGMEAGDGDDLGVILYSGHGEMVGDESFYLLPHGASTGSAAAIEASGIAASVLHDKIAQIARHGRVLLFLDACRSGGITAPTGRSLRAVLQASNVTIFASSMPGEASLESRDWENGAFTEALIEALRSEHRGRETIGIGDLYIYLSQRVPELTGDKQHPDAEIRGRDADLFAVVR